MLSACHDQFSYWTKRLFCTDISTQPFVVGSGVVMVSHSSGSDSEPPQQDPVQLALHEADPQETEAGVVQCGGLHWIKRVCKACIVHQAGSRRMLPGIPITFLQNFLFCAFQQDSSPATTGRRAIC